MTANTSKILCKSGMKTILMEIQLIPEIQETILPNIVHQEKYNQHFFKIQEFERLIFYYEFIIIFLNYCSKQRIRI